jgi:plastocyanin
MIAFVSDNGYSYGEHRRGLQKSDPYEEDIRSPMIVRYDPLTSTPRTDSTHLVANIDWAPTFADLAGVSSPGAEGSSLMPLIRNQQVTWRTDVALEHLQGVGDDIDTYCGVRNAGFVYVRYRTGEDELYDLAADPDQLNSVAKDPAYASTLASMKARAITLCNPPPPGFNFNVNPPVVSIDSAPAGVTTEQSATFTFSANQSNVGFKCEIDGVVLSSCTSPKTYTNLARGDHFFSVSGTKQGLVGTTAWHWAVAAPVAVSDFKFTPATVKPGQGVTVLWSFNGPSNHTVTDTTGMNLYDTGPMGPGTSFSYRFAAAGTYTYECTIHPGQMQGQSKVPLLISPNMGNLSTVFNIGWASEAAPAGLAYDVQIKRPGSNQWKIWMNTVSNPTATFVADGGTGTYSFRARLKKTSTQFSGWSTVKTLIVNP